VRASHNRIAAKICDIRNQVFQKCERITAVCIITGMRNHFCSSRGKAKFKLCGGCLCVGSVAGVTTRNESAGADQ